MIITDKDINVMLERLNQMSQDFQKFKHATLTSTFLKEYEITYYHAQAILELKLLDVRKRLGNARMKEYRWTGGEPTLIMARKVLEMAEEIKSGLRTKPIDFTDNDKLNMVKNALRMLGYEFDLDDKKLLSFINVIEYISENEWDSKIHDIVNLSKEE